MADKKTQYPAKKFRMNEETYKNLAEIKKQVGKSWNLTFMELIKKYQEKQSP